MGFNSGFKGLSATFSNASTLLLFQPMHNNFALKHYILD